jgi:hypothetical protein
MVSKIHWAALFALIVLAVTVGNLGSMWIAESQALRQQQ